MRRKARKIQVPNNRTEDKKNLSCQQRYGRLRKILVANSKKKKKRKKIDEFLPEEEQIYQSQGLVSIDRGEAAALLSTTPRLRRRSSTNDLAPLHCMGWISLRHPDSQSRAGRLPLCCGFAITGAESGRPAPIVASQCRGTTVSLHFWAGF